ncbi:hypothetical protein CL629_01085 [bacterium]|nr:hypothetical protein [bacterium]
MDFAGIGPFLVFCFPYLWTDVFVGGGIESLLAPTLILVSAAILWLGRSVATLFEGDCKTPKSMRQCGLLIVLLWISTTLSTRLFLGLQWVPLAFLSAPILWHLGWETYWIRLAFWRYSYRIEGDFHGVGPEDLAEILRGATGRVWDVPAVPSDPYILPWDPPSNDALEDAVLWIGGKLGDDDKVRIVPYYRGS